MPDLVFELGCEELPATFVRRAYEQLEAEIGHRLSEAGLSFYSSESLGTPRRLIVGVFGLQSVQPDVVKEVRGPSASAAFDASGAPSKALEGFCRGQGVDVKAVRVEGEYVFVTKTVLGLPTAEVLAEVLPASVRALTFDKSMRWGAGKMRFARPIRWMLASFDEKPVPFAVESVTSGTQSRGHRFYSPEPFTALTFASLLAELRARKVEPDAAIREKRIREDSIRIADGSPEMTDALVDENTFLTEWPTAVRGQFDAQYLDLPDSVLVTAMAKHERSFPVRDAAGKITNRFISIRNSGVDDVVAAGFEWVLSARFNDANFFYREDKKYTLDDFLQRTDRLTFQEKLGTVRERADRLAKLTESLSECIQGPDVPKYVFRMNVAEREEWKTAGLYAKADLSTGLVSELPSLQGVIGSEYARRAGMPESVCVALAKQYEPSKITDFESKGDRAAMALVQADQLDKLAGYLGIGLVPTGNADPNGLRRCATILIDLAWRSPRPLGSYRPKFERALDGYQKIELDADKAFSTLYDLFSSRYTALLATERPDIVAGALSGTDPFEILDPQCVRMRVEVLRQASADAVLVQTLKRPLNIFDAAESDIVGLDIYDEGNPSDSELLELPVDQSQLDSREGISLLSEIRARSQTITTAAGRLDSAELFSELKALAPAIHAFFEATMINDPDPGKRKARLQLVGHVCSLIEKGGDFRKIVFEGA